MRQKTPPAVLEFAAEPPAASRCATLLLATTALLAGVGAGLQAQAPTLPGYPDSGHFPFGSTTTSETWSGGGAELLLYGDGTVLQIVDVSDPSHLTPLHAVETNELVRSIDVLDDGSLVAICDGTEWLTLVDLEQPEPAVVGRLQVESGRRPSAAAFGPPGSDLIYVAITPIGLRVVDISDPASPVVVGNYEEPGTDFVFDIELSGNYAFLADDVQGLTAIDVSNPAMPTLSARLDTSDTQGASQIEIVGDRAFLARRGDGFNLIDLDVSGTPAVMTARGWLDRSTDRSEPFDADHVLVGAQFQSVALVDITDPDTPTVVETYSNSAASLAALGSTVFSHRRQDFSNPQLRSVDFDTGNPSAPEELDALPLNGPALDVEIGGDLALVSMGIGGLALVDISDVSSPVFSGNFRLLGDEIFAAARVGNAAIAVTRHDEVQVIDLTDPSMPVALTPYDTGAVVDHLEVLADGTTVALPANLLGVELVDFSTPAAPVQVGVWPAPADGLAQRVSIDGDRMAVSGFVTARGGSANRVWWVDISNPASPLGLASFDVPRPVKDLDLRGDLVYVADGTEGLLIWDVDQPGGPQQVGSYTTAVSGLPIDALGISVVGPTAYLAGSTANGLLVLDVSLASAPVETLDYDTTGEALKVLAAGGRVAFADGDGGVRLWGFTPLFADGFETGDTDGWSTTTP